MKTTKQRLEDIRRLAPSIAITTSRSHDEPFTWDGDGPKPKGFFPYDVTVKATVVAHGVIMAGKAYLGGSYYRPDEPLGDIHGYLAQMIDDAIQDLLKRNSWEKCDAYIIEQAGKVSEYITQWLTEEYNAQRKQFAKKKGARS